MFGKVTFDEHVNFRKGIVKGIYEANLKKNLMALFPTLGPERSNFN